MSLCTIELQVLRFSRRFWYFIESGSVSLVCLYNLSRNLIECKIPLVIHGFFLCLKWLNLNFFGFRYFSLTDDITCWSISHDMFISFCLFDLYISKLVKWGKWSEHGDVIKWKHFPRYWPFVRGIHRSTVNFPHKGQWRGALMFSLIYARVNGWVNNREVGDLRRYLAHYDVTVMCSFWLFLFVTLWYLYDFKFSGNKHQLTWAELSWIS